MKKIISKIWLPVVILVLSVSSLAGRTPVRTREGLGKAAYPDTIKYSIYGYRSGWSKDELSDMVQVDSAILASLDSLHALDTLLADSLLTDSLTLDSLSLDSLALDSLGIDSLLQDSLKVVLARDTIKIPDSLELTDPFRFKYYLAIVDSLTHQQVRDSLIAAGDTLDWPKIDSLFSADSALAVKLAFDQWYGSLSRKEQREYDREQVLLARQAVRDSVALVRDSLLTKAPRILESPYVSGEMYYEQTMLWNPDKDFLNVNPHLPDSSLNRHFDDFRFNKDAVGATWLGVSGSAVRPLDYFKQTSDENVSFYDPLQYWSYSHSTLPMYNTKVPYTELGYTGTLFSGTQKEEDNVHLLTTTNITPALNFAMSYDRNGSNGILNLEKTASKSSWISLNYLGQKYFAQAGLIHHAVTRQENGGIIDNSWIRDTTVEAREIQVALSSAAATSEVEKTTIFLDQQYKLLPTIYAGHSSELSTYQRSYTDKITSNSGTAANFFSGNFHYHPTTSSDLLKLTRFDNKVFAKFKASKDDSFISGVYAGAGDLYQRYATLDPSFIRPSTPEVWNSVYVYGGADGELFHGLEWEGKAKLFMLGKQAGDLSAQAGLTYEIFPFRKARTSPLTVKASFETTLSEPDYYQQHLLTNHFKWDNDFSKISVSKLRASLDIPYWSLKAEAGYSLLAGNIYYGPDMTVAQNSKAMSVLSAYVQKDIALFRDLVHLEHRVLGQLSSDQEVLPLPLAALNLRYYLQFGVKDVLKIQAGANALYNTSWYTPGYNPVLGVFYNQREETYNNGPYVDAFVNLKWSTCSIFVKYENAGAGWLTPHDDYFSAHHYINTTSTIKLGVFWPFSAKPSKGNGTSDHHSEGGNGRSSAAARAASGLE